VIQSLEGSRQTPTYLVPLLAAAATVVLVWPVVAHAIGIWSANEDLTFGFLLPPTAAWLAWSRRRLVRAAARAGSSRGVLVVLAAVGLFLLCERISAKSPAAVAAGLLIWGEIYYLWGWRLARLLAFPIGLVTFGLALQPTLITPVAFFLQSVTAVTTAAVSQLLGEQVIREGLVLRSETFAVVVAEACSGMNSLLALLAVAGVWLYIAPGRLAGSFVVLASVLPIVLVANTARVEMVLLVASRLGQDAALGFFHTGSSLILFGLELVGLFLVSRLAGCRLAIL
jgi:exosortase